MDLAAQHIPPVERRGPSATVVLVVMLSMFGSAAMIFMLQPLFARMVTPLLGGSPAVWNTSMIFFQAALLGGYLYAHLLQRLRSITLQAAVHGGFLLLAGLTLPVRPTTWLGAPDVQNPTVWLLGVLALSVGAPYLVASATAPLLQSWYARSGREDAGDPYFLYGASNLGSLLGLLMYPLAVEPLLGVRQQGAWWAWGYAAAALLVSVSGLLVARGAHPIPVVGTVPEAGARSGWSQRFFWMSAAAVPSSLLIGTTQHVLTDIASAPFLWVPPLALYLLTYVLAFRKGAGAPGTTLLALHAGLIAMSAAAPSTPYIVLDLLIRLGALFSAALVCHGALAASRPAAAHLTEFYNFVSLGGVLGGALTALAAPLVFDRITEFPLALAATWFFRPRQDIEWKPVADIVLVGAVAALAALIAGWLPLQRGLLGLLAVAIFLNRVRPWIAAPLVIAAMMVPEAFGARGDVILRDRTFFGVYRVVAVSRPDGVGHMLLHGSTVHGVQWRDSARASRPLSYYAQGGAVHEAVRAALPPGRPAHVALIGLGSGAMACVLREADRATFMEIDPAVVKIARDPRYFTYLSACPRNTEVRVGDGRLEMQRLEAGSLDVVLGDAFSSDAIPIHLLTREAVRGYMRAIRPSGALVLHVSNRHLAVANEAVRVAAAEGFSASYWRSPPGGGGTYNFERPSASVVVIAHSDSAMKALGLGSHWRAAPTLSGSAWSDDFVDLVRTMREAAIDAVAIRPVVTDSASRGMR